MLISVPIWTSGTEFSKFYHKGSFLKEKAQKMLTKFPGLATSDCHNYRGTQWLQITWNSLPNWRSMECLVFSFTVRINSKSFPWTLRSAQERYLPKFLASSDVWYCLFKPIVCHSAGAAWRLIYWRNADWIGNWKWVMWQITLTSLSRRHVTLGIIECRK